MTDDEKKLLDVWCKIKEHGEGELRGKVSPRHPGRLALFIDAGETWRFEVERDQE